MTVAKFWQQARAVLGAAYPEEPPQAWSFGDSPELANELLDLVLSGRKTATCDALWRFEAESEPLPAPGDLSIILDGSGIPRCVLETTDVRISPMNEVDEQFAFDEGEDDRTWNSWFAAHENYFHRVLPGIGREFSPAIPLVLERFRLMYPR
ncbi:MAG: ASCH domain-containing protein [Thermomicrobiales bacterium]